MVARSWRWLSVIVAGLAGFLLIAYVVLKLAPNWFAETKSLDAKGRADARQDVRTASLALLAGAIGVIGALYTARTFALNRAGQLTDRFTKAIEQLGHQEELDVRLGGIYALERVARDSREDHPQVVEVLTAYVREHAPRRDTPPSDPGAHESQVEGTPQIADVPAGTASTRPATDVQAVLTVLGRRTLAHEQDTRRVLDLSSTHLSAANLRGANLSGASLGGASLGGASLGGADLSGANLSGANLSEADLSEADFSGADLSWANLITANLSGANLSGANLRGANLSGADLIRAHLARADLIGADLSGADLRGADLIRAHLMRAHLGANLSGANLSGADLREADLIRANLSGADLREADLIRAHLSGANLSGANLNRAGFDRHTSWPKDFDPNAAGARDLHPE